MNSRNLIAVFIIVILAAVAGFFAGSKFQGANFRSGNQTFFQNGEQRTGMMNGRFGNGNPNGARGGRGQVVDINGNSMTIKLNDGTTKLVNLTSSTTYVKTATASSSDVKTGDTVLVIGTSNSDGSITAQDIQIGGNLFQRGISPTPTP